MLTAAQSSWSLEELGPHDSCGVSERLTFNSQSHCSRQPMHNLIPFKTGHKIFFNNQGPIILVMAKWSYPNLVPGTKSGSHIWSGTKSGSHIWSGIWQQYLVLPDNILLQDSVLGPNVAARFGPTLPDLVLIWDQILQQHSVLGPNLAATFRPRTKSGRKIVS